MSGIEDEVCASSMRRLTLILGKLFSAGVGVCALLALCVLPPACSSSSGAQTDAVDIEPISDAEKSKDEGNSPQTKAGIPLKPSDKLLLSRRGAHSYVQFPPLEVSGEPTTGVVLGPSLFWRHYSDVVSHFGVYSPLLNPMFRLSALDLCGAVENYGWYGANVVRKYSCGSLQVNETTAYADASTIAVRFRLFNTSDQTGAVTISGATVSSGVVSTVNWDDQTAAFRISLTGSFVTYWSDPTPVQWDFTVSSSPPATSIDIPESNREWAFNYAVLPNETMDVVLTFCLGEEEVPQLKTLDPGALYHAVADAEDELEAWFAEAPDITRLSEPAYALSWYLFWENAAAPRGNWVEEAVTPSKRHYFRGVWLWETAFHALALAHGGQGALELARKQTLLFLQKAASDGRIPGEIWVSAVGPGAHPPGLLTWATLVTAKALQDESIIVADYPILKANHQWLEANFDSDGDGLYEWGGADSGWDTSPRWDGGPVEALDLACWMYLDATLLAKMAQILAKTAEMGEWNTQAETLAAAIQTQFWHQDDKFFYDLAIKDNRFLRVKTPAAFIPLFVGVASQEQAEVMAATLTDPQIFGTPVPIPSVAVSSEVYKQDNYWRGASWVVLNALAVWGLERYGLAEPAAQLRKATLELVAAHDNLFECYDSQTGKGLGAPDFTWTGALFLLLSGSNPTIW